MSDEIKRYQIGVREGVEVPYSVTLACEALDRFKNYMEANRQRPEIARRHGIEPHFLEVKTIR